MLPVNQILQGSALARLKQLPDNSIDTCITSPPYWGLRDYKHSDQLGQEATPKEYINHLLEIFAEVKRVIKETGSIWVNLGDSYNNNKSLSGIPERFSIAMTDELVLIRRNTVIWYKPNCMPSSASDRFTVDFEYIYFFTKSQRYHFETQYEPYQDYQERPTKKGGWNSYSTKSGLIRSRVQSFMNTERVIEANSLGRQKRCVWKISTRSFSDAHFAVYPQQLIEPIVKAACPEFVCSKCGQARKLVYETSRLNTRPGIDTGNGKSGTADDPNQGLHKSDLSKFRQQVVRTPKFGGNRAAEYGNRTYSGKEWNPKIRVPINTKGNIKDTHAMHTMAEYRNRIRQQGVKNDTVIRRLKTMGSDDEGNYNGQSTKDYDSAQAQDASETKRRILESYKKRANSDVMMTSCNCNAGFESGILLDPFFGSGTSGIVALQQGKKFIGIELNQSYIDIALKRLKPYLDQSTLTEYLGDNAAQHNSSTLI